jgi:hypothetical protein
VGSPLLSEVGKEAVGMVCGGGEKSEEGRTKNENRLLTWSVEAENFLFSFFYFRSWPWFPSPREKERKKKNQE